jgi:hypothetical protein
MLKCSGTALKITGPSINHQLIDGEVVAINLVSGTYYSLVDTAAAVWDRIVTGKSRAAILDEFADAFGAEAGVAVSAFLDQLVSEGLALDEEIEGMPGDPRLPLAESFKAPRLESFTDMQELLMLDPIHEIDEIGWPHRNGNS